RHGEELFDFIDAEKSRLEELRSILTGEVAADHERLETLINECDYLHAHFPDYTEKPDCRDITFLKRIRVEIDPILNIIRLLL
ncbi:MAG: hypothetical protein LBU66_01160, partial [Treponema sp.]|nr:hypothetical protein [Treponema sp.]